MYKRALLPLDGSMVAEAIVPFLPEIAGLLDMEILAGARDVEADLIAMTTHGRGGLGSHLERDAANADKGRSRRRKS